MNFGKFKTQVLGDFELQKPVMGKLPVTVDYIYGGPSVSVIRRYDSKKRLLQSKGIKYEERIVYHGTYEENLESIMKNGFQTEKCGSRMQSHFGKGIYTSQNIEVSLYYCYGGIHLKNAYDTDRSRHKLLACRILVVNEHVSKLYCQGWTPDESSETFSFVSNDLGASPQTVIYRDENILPLFVIQTK